MSILPNHQNHLVRWLTQADLESARFEKELLSHGVTLRLPQSHDWIESTHKKFRLLQVRTSEGRAVYQVIVRIEQPRYTIGFLRGFAAQLTPPVSSFDEGVGLKILKKYASKDLLELRLEPYRQGIEALKSFEIKAKASGFESTEPLGVTQTLIGDLPLSLSLSQKTYRKIHSITKERFEIRSLTSAHHIPACQKALSDSFLRTGSVNASFDFKTAFQMAQITPEKVKIFGLYFKSDPHTLLAYVIGYLHGVSAEYVSAGSLSNEKLRKAPFNYFLLWELISWAHKRGAKSFDFGGISEGHSHDTRAGISEFKRHFCNSEISVGYEMRAVLKPAQSFIFDAVHFFKNS